MNQTPHQQIEAILNKHREWHDWDMGRSDGEYPMLSPNDSVLATKAVFKGLPAMQEEPDVYRHVSTFVDGRNALRRQILAELEAGS